MSADVLAGHVGGLHDLAEKLEQTGIPLSAATIDIHTEDGADAARLADALGLTDRHDFTKTDPVNAAGRAFTRWAGDYDGVRVVVFGTTPKEDPR